MKYQMNVSNYFENIVLSESAKKVIFNLFKKDVDLIDICLELENGWITNIVTVKVADEVKTLNYVHSDKTLFRKYINIEDYAERQKNAFYIKILMETLKWQKV